MFHRLTFAFLYTWVLLSRSVLCLPYTKLFTGYLESLRNTVLGSIASSSQLVDEPLKNKEPVTIEDIVLNSEQLFEKHMLRDNPVLENDSVLKNDPGIKSKFLPPDAFEELADYYKNHKIKGVVIVANPSSSEEIKDLFPDVTEPFALILMEQLSDINDNEKKELLEGQTSQPQEIISLIWLKQIPDYRLTQRELTAIFQTAFLVQRNLDAAVPTKEIVSALLNSDEQFPLIFPGQAGPLPIYLRDVRCGRDIEACVRLGDWGRVIGNLMFFLYDNSVTGKTQARMKNEITFHADNLFEKLTPTLVDFLEQGIIVNIIAPLIETRIPDDAAIIMTYYNVTEIFWTLADVVAPTDTSLQAKQSMTDKVKAARLCRLFNGRLPNCVEKPIESILPTFPPVPPNDVFDPTTGLLAFLFVWGFEFSCDVQGSCISGTSSMQPENFDGFYVLVDVDERGFPIYEKAVDFIDFIAIKTLFLWQSSNSNIRTGVLREGTYAAITPFVPEFSPGIVTTRPPLAFIFLPPPNDCTLLPPPPFDGSLSYFPACLQVTNHWRFIAPASGGCSGLLFNFICFFPAIVNIYGVNLFTPLEDTNENEVKNVTSLNGEVKNDYSEKRRLQGEKKPYSQNTTLKPLIFSQIFQSEKLGEMHENLNKQHWSNAIREGRHMEILNIRQNMYNYSQ